jgi:hypothetical protein
MDQNDQKANQTNSTTSSEESKRALKLATMTFEELSTIYGARFRGQWTSDENRAHALMRWAKELSRFEQENLEAALNALVSTDRYKDDPPNLVQFVDLCRQYMREEQKPHLRLVHSRDELTKEQRIAIVKQWRIAAMEKYLDAGHMEALKNRVFDLVNQYGPDWRDLLLVAVMYEREGIDLTDAQLITLAAKYAKGINVNPRVAKVVHP